VTFRLLLSKQQEPIRIHVAPVAWGGKGVFSFHKVGGIFLVFLHFFKEKNQDEVEDQPK